MTDIMKPQQGMPPRVWPVFSAFMKTDHKQFSLLVPMGFTSRPYYHLEFMARTFGLQTAWMFFTLDWKKGVKGSLRIQRQRKQFATKYAVMIPE